MKLLVRKCILPVVSSIALTLPFGNEEEHLFCQQTPKVTFETFGVPLANLHKPRKWPLKRLVVYVLLASIHIQFVFVCWHKLE